MIDFNLIVDGQTGPVWVDGLLVFGIDLASSNNSSIVLAEKFNHGTLTTKLTPHAFAKIVDNWSGEQTIDISKKALDDPHSYVNITLRQANGENVTYLRRDPK
jgi:hypothetical protein